MKYCHAPEMGLQRVQGGFNYSVCDLAVKH